MKDLFNRDIPEHDIVKGKAHAGTPGRGPQGETCKTCAYYLRVLKSRVYLKCGLTDWTNGPATDIRAGDPACEKWKAETKGVEQ
jgi:hypothetical protein